MVDKIAGPEPVKPTSALTKKLADTKKSKLKQRLISNSSSEGEDDSDDEPKRNPIKKDTEQGKYLPPQLALNASLNDSVVSQSRLDQLAQTPRSQLSQSDRTAVDQDAIMTAYMDKRDPDVLKKVVPKPGQPFKPPTGTRITPNDVEKALSQRSG